MSKKVKRVFFTLTVILLTITVVVVIALQLAGFRFRAVLSGSMEPELPVGSLLVIKDRDLEEITIGDDITFVRDKNLTVVTHRVIAIDKENQLLTTQGIANNTPDAPVYYENVLGVVEYTVPYVGYAISWLDTTQGKIIAITVIVAAVLIWMILGALFEKKKDDPPGEKKTEVKKDKKSKNVKNPLPPKLSLGSWLEEEEEKENIMDFLDEYDTIESIEKLFDLSDGRG